MALFQYAFLDVQGKTCQGTIDADTLQEAKAKLLQNKITALHIASLEGKKMRVKVTKSDLLQFTRELSRLLTAGLPLFEAVMALQEKYCSHKLQPLLLDLADQIRAGSSFSASLARHPACFDLLYVSLIANAEKTGSLTYALNELTALLQKQIHLRKQLISALLYPGLLAVFCFFVLGSLFFYVIPSLKELFEGREVHSFTQLVFSISDFSCRHRTFLAFLFLAMNFFVFLVCKLPLWRSKALSCIYRLPGIRSFLVQVAWVRFCRACSALLEGGVTPLSAFESARKVMHHPPLEAIVAAAEEKLTQGEPFYRSLQNHPLIPPLVPRMLAIAEKGGKLPFMMQQIAFIYEDEVDSFLVRFTSVIQPLLLLILGGIIALVLLSVLLPLTDVSSFAMN